MSFEDNPADDVQPTQEQWELMELRNDTRLLRAERDALQSKLDRVREACKIQVYDSFTGYAFKEAVLAAIEKGGGE